MLVMRTSLSTFLVRRPKCSANLPSGFVRGRARVYLLGLSYRESYGIRNQGIRSQRISRARLVLGITFH